MAIEVGAVAQGISFAIRFHNDWQSLRKKIEEGRNYHPTITTNVDALAPAMKSNINVALATGETIYHFSSIVRHAPSLPKMLGVVAVGVLSGLWMRKFVLLR